MSTFIRDWEELSKIPNESETHILEIEHHCGCGWLKAKNKKDYDETKEYMDQVQNLDIYLSTHTFYGRNYKHSTEVLKACGFDVELDNWDKEE